MIFTNEHEPGYLNINPKVANGSYVARCWQSILHFLWKLDFIAVIYL